jgi:7-cyano-7-deazaguanine synthase
VTSTDYSGYPDCRPEYIDAFQKLTDIATKKTVDGKKISIVAPLLKLSKSEIIKRGIELNVPLDETWSCYYGREAACGRCDSCILRLKGFKDLGLKDPLDYEKE